MKFVLVDTLNRLVSGPLGAPLTYEERAEAIKAACRRLEPTRVAEMRVIFEPTLLN